MTDNKTRPVTPTSDNKTQIIAGMTIQEDVLKLRIENEQLKEQNTYLKQSLDWANEREKEQIEKMKELLEQIEKINEEVKANADYQIEGRELEIKELKAQIEKMKCCQNCAWDNKYDFYDDNWHDVCGTCDNLCNWKLKE